MRRFFNGLVVLSFVACLSVPAYAAPRRDGGGDGFYRDSIKKIVQVIKKLIKAPLDDMSFPKP